MYILVSQEAAKISEVKVGGRKENCQLNRLRTQCTQGRLTWQIFYQPLTLTFDILQRLDLQLLQECTAPHFKDLIHICLEPEVQDCGMTFNRFYVGSKYPYFVSYRGKWLYLFCRVCTCKFFSNIRN